ncbi:hypothetical protein [Fodinibius salsisoli]|uniref:DUF2933 domain-containing protein n=1 Tax=Fodinibius salsisoli TaxID=2820877 RepID=A0ABT3PJT6_9BACT|nr:hypothetical protein [Fodinibius salsisoli]MCW9706218.1 hypothetical protein [Fodinibius salsisoli]
MDNKMMMLMMLGCMAMALLFSTVPSGWFSGGIGILLLIMLLFACCIPMVKMMMGTEEEKP